MPRRHVSADQLPELVTYAEAERLLGVKRSTVYRLVRRGDLEAIAITPKAIRIRVDSIDRHLRAKAVEAKAVPA